MWRLPPATWMPVTPRAVTPGEPLDLGPGDYVAGDFPYVCGALEPSTTVLMAVEHV
jgi:hypothetical protein